MMVLVGPRGVGKTTLGQCMAIDHGWRWQDSDQVICQDLGVSAIRDAYQTLGEQAFRQLESDVIRRCLAKNLDVLTLGGGALGHDATCQILLGHCCVALSMPMHQLWQRWQNTPRLRTWITGPQSLACFNAYWLRRQQEVASIQVSWTLDASHSLCEQASCLKKFRCCSVPG